MNKRAILVTGIIFCEAMAMSGFKLLQFPPWV